MFDCKACCCSHRLAQIHLTQRRSTCLYLELLRGVPVRKKTTLYVKTPNVDAQYPYTTKKGTGKWEQRVYWIMQSLQIMSFNIIPVTSESIIARNKSLLSAMNIDNVKINTSLLLIIDDRIIRDPSSRAEITRILAE